MATYFTYSSEGIKENLSDLIYSIAPEETPFMSNIGRRQVSNTLYEWQEDTLSAAGDSAIIEGGAATSTQTAPKRMQNYAQLNAKRVTVSGTLEAVDKAGRNSELQYELARKSSELKRDMEFALTQNQIAVAGDSSTARKTAGLESWLRTNTSRGSGGTTDGADPELSATTSGFPDTAPVDASSDAERALTEALLKTIVQEVWTEGGDPSILMVGAANKQVVSGFAGIAAQRYMAPNDAPSTIIGAADVYVSDFGSVQVVPNRFQRNRTAFVLDPEYAEVAFLRDFEVQDLAKTGDAEDRQIVVEFGLQVSNEKAHGVIADLS
mgnify:CR=1 FL=1